MLFYKIGNIIAHIISFLWIIILWIPLIPEYISSKNPSNMYVSLTWWCWTFQSIFYTSMFFYRKLEVFLQEIHFMIIISRFFPKTTDYLFSLIGMVWFVFLMFCWLLYNDPKIITERMGTDKNNNIKIQIGNILIHYYIITVISIWLLFDTNNIRRDLDIFIKNSKFPKVRIVLNWIIPIFIYVFYWEFRIDLIFRNYNINYIPYAECIIISMATCFICIVFFSSLYKNIYITRHKQIQTSSNKKKNINTQTMEVYIL
jgi:hypothetical protein